ncbi:hypothetical protein AWC38_SpisGene12558 [Stylophora pistillata]|uniref:Uncharacterized protein n=2 Tax=Stylophora pistillata TaxID=50429 RepID=A0A2B4S1G5_STYPI|nr:hypothetical protein AWC38_SpisGene12558 [Stylophora pistillata]
MKAIEKSNTRCISTAVEPIQVSISPAESPFNEKHNTIFDENEKTAKNGSGGLIQSVSKILNSQFGVPRHHPFNYRACLPTPTPLYQLPWSVGEIYTGGFHQNNWQGSETETSCFSVMEPLPCTNFTVSDNSAFVKYNSVSPRMEINSFRFGLSESFETAAVLTPFAGIRSMENRDMKDKTFLIHTCPN